MKVRYANRALFLTQQIAYNSFSFRKSCLSHVSLLHTWYACLAVYELSTFCCCAAFIGGTPSCPNPHHATVFQFEKKKKIQTCMEFYLICIMVVFITTGMFSSCFFLLLMRSKLLFNMKNCFGAFRSHSFIVSIHDFKDSECNRYKTLFLQQMPNIVEQLLHLTLVWAFECIPFKWDSLWYEKKFFHGQVQ